MEEELSDELQFHVDRLTEQYAARGMNSKDARSKALRDVGNVDGWKEHAATSVVSICSTVCCAILNMRCASPQSIESFRR